MGKICDLFKTGDVKGIRNTSLDKEVSASYKNIIALHNGDIIAPAPSVHLTYSKNWRGALPYVEAIDISFSTVFIANIDETKPKLPLQEIFLRFFLC